MHKVLFWTGFGMLVRIWQLGLEMRPLFARETLWTYPTYGAVGASFGYWMTNVERRQSAMLKAQRDRLLEKRKRREEREAKAALDKEGNGTTQAA